MPIRVETYPTLAEAARALSQPRTRFLGGGTVLMRAVNHADPSFDTLVRTSDPAARAMRTGGDVELGAGVTMADILAERDLAMLHPAARAIGGPQVRAAATIAGNLFSGRPYGDFATLLIALGASVETVEGRRIAVEEVVRSPPRALVAKITIPRPSGTVRFAKVARVKPKGISLMSLAVHLPRGGGRDVRVAFNGMGPHPMRAAGAERALATGFDARSLERAVGAVADGLDPPDDALASAWYRREVAGIHLRRLLEAA